MKAGNRALNILESEACASSVLLDPRDTILIPPTHNSLDFSVTMLSRPLSNKLQSKDPIIKSSIQVKKMMTVPKGGFYLFTEAHAAPISSLASISSSFDGEFSNPTSLLPSCEAVGDDLIRPFPPGIYPAYRPMPLLTKSLILLSSALILFFSSYKIKHKQHPSPRRILVLLWRYLLIGLASTATVQELFFAPSRLATSTLASQDWLPSTLSKISIVHPSVRSLENLPLFKKLQQSSKDEKLRMDQIIKAMEPSLQVHYLSYHNSKNKSENSPFKFDAVALFHGFGASSLSWLPVIRPLVDDCGARVGLAHDAAGFGFSERPSVTTLPLMEKVLPYSFDTSAGTAISLMPPEPKRLLVVGHSMGALSALRMAEKLPKTTKISILLVSPAILGNAPSSTGKLDASFVSSITKYFWIPPLLKQTLWLLTRVVVLKPFEYVLRRYVGSGSSWGNGLRSAWGDPSRVTSFDVLRYQWPSISLGWESGLVNFSISRLLGAGNYVGGDVKLFQDVSKQDNVDQILFVHGTEDKVVTYKNTQRLIKSLGENVASKVKLVPMDGAGHCGHEERPEDFMDIVISHLK